MSKYSFNQEGIDILKGMELCTNNETERLELSGIYCEQLPKGEGEKEYVLLCATDGHIIYAQKIEKDSLLHAAMTLQYHEIPTTRKNESIWFSHKKFLSSLEKDKEGLIYPNFRKVIYGTPIKQNGKELVYGFFDPDYLLKAKKILNKIWIPNFRGKDFASINFYIEPELLIGIMPLRSRKENQYFPETQYTQVFPELSPNPEPEKPKAVTRKIATVKKW